MRELFIEWHIHANVRISKTDLEPCNRRDTVNSGWCDCWMNTQARTEYYRDSCNLCYNTRSNRSCIVHQEKRMRLVSFYLQTFFFFFLYFFRADCYYLRVIWLCICNLEHRRNMPEKTNMVTTQMMPMFQAANSVALGCVTHISTPDKNTQTAARGYLKKSATRQIAHSHSTIIIIIISHVTIHRRLIKRYFRIRNNPLRIVQESYCKNCKRKKIRNYHLKRYYSPCAPDVLIQYWQVIFRVRTNNYRVLISCVGRVFWYEKHRFHVIGLLV